MPRVNFAPALEHAYAQAVYARFINKYEGSGKNVGWQGGSQKEPLLAKGHLLVGILRIQTN